MPWVKIDKSSGAQPANGKYPDWKPILATEGHHQCIYCAIHDVSLGGIRNFHVEHYKPKSKFGHLENTISNLFYACPICNTLKGNDWPCDVHDNPTSQCYPDPSQVDYNCIFVQRSSMEVEGLTPAAKYMVVRLYLNRKQLIVERKKIKAINILKTYRPSIEDHMAALLRINDPRSKELLFELATVQNKLHKLWTEIPNLDLYTHGDISR